MNMAGIYPGSSVVMPQNMMISGNATGINNSSVGLNPNEYKMKHNSSNQSMHSQKKIGNISTIRKPGAELHGGMSLHVTGGNQSNLTNKNYKYMSPYAKNLNKK
jgi:hypothetical protein